MHGTKEFDVIQTLQQGEQCHIVLNHISGRTLEEICRENRCISKEEFYSWMEQIFSYLAHLHKCRPVRIYQFLTPYTVIIGNNGKVYLLDTENESSREIVRRHFQKKVQSAFFPIESRGCRRPGTAHDLYAAGKTMQYVLAKCEVLPELGRIEERRLYRMIRKIEAVCAGKAAASAEDLMAALMRCKGKEKAETENGPGWEAGQRKESVHMWRKYLAASAVIIVAAAGIQAMFSHAGDSKSLEQMGVGSRSQTEHEYQKMSVRAESGGRAADEDNIMEKAELNQELGLLYFQKVQDYEASIPYFAEAKEEVRSADAYEILARYRCGTYGVTREEAWNAVQVLLEETDSYSPLNQAEALTDCIRVYAQMEDTEEELKLIEECLGNESEWRAEDTDGALRRELYERGAVIYCSQNKWEDALVMQKVLFAEAEEGQEYDTACLALGNMYFQSGRFKEGAEVSLEGMEKCIDRAAAAINYTKNMCADQELSVGEKEKKLTEMLEKVPETLSDSDFEKLQKEQNFTVHEGRICFG